jgi:trehalose 6-phosphate phosphatase
MTLLPGPVTPEGRAGLDALLTDPRHALLGTDFDGTLSPIVADPAHARPHPGAIPVMTALASVLGTLAIITGRPADLVAGLGFDAVPGIIVLGHYGWQRWQEGKLTALGSWPAVQTARQMLPDVLSGAGAPDGTWIEDKGDALAVHFRRVAHPGAAERALRGPLGDLAQRLGLAFEPGRFVLELRPPGADKGVALTSLVRERGARSVVFCGDDLGDLAAFAAIRSLRADGIPGTAVASDSPESPQVAVEADLVAEGPDGIVDLLAAIARRLGC